ncbi:polysaccharide biosynthesis/export family protein [Zavarzinia sp.]|uniref:polysaccharide biosynthesis/export family protein n=1 Tax=Zavarzinia sp. TaxID=2027920 RepID=UPI003BB7E2AB
MAVSLGHPHLFAAILVAAGLLSGCTGQEVYIQEDVVKPDRFSTWVDSKPQYHIGPGDILQVKFLLTPEMDDEVTVSPDGHVGLRTTGQIEAAGLTPGEFESKIKVAARRFLAADAVVAVQVKTYASSRIYVGGSIAAPGAYLVTGPVTPLEAIINAGGFRDEARPDEVVLIRRAPDGKPMMRTIDIQNFIQRMDPADDVMLVSGDLLFVPRSLAGEVGHWVEQYIDNTLPWDPQFNYSINRTWQTETGRTLPPL